MTVRRDRDRNGSGERRREDSADLVYGVRPIQELLDRRAGDVERILVARRSGPGIGGILRLARERGIPVSHLERAVLARKAGPRAVHQGIAAQVAPLPYADAEEVCRTAASRSAAILVLVDGVVDPRNLGAIVRTAAAAGASGVLIGGGESVGLTPAVAKTSAGAVERIPVAREPRPARRIGELRKAGFRAYCLDPRGEADWSSVDLTGRLLAVVGGENRGVRPGVAKACDKRVAIPVFRGVESLNVAVASGVLLFEAVRQRRGGS